MKGLIYHIVGFLMCIGVYAQTFKTTSGSVYFNASTPLEDIVAVNYKVNAILVEEKGKFAAVLLIKDFSFRRKLMQEHFNENYMESDRYPKAYFNGIIEQFDYNNLTSALTIFRINGELTIHGVTRKITENIMLGTNNNQIRLESDFTIKPEDYQIEVPKLLFKKIAKQVRVHIELNLKQI